jgi:hypothetical protein
MTRLALVLAAWMGLLSVGSASLTPRKKSPAVGDEVPPVRSSRLASQTTGQAAGRGNGSDFAVTHGTELLLNGKPCRYQDVPADARIVHMEVAADRKTVLKIHFRVGK